MREGAHDEEDDGKATTNTEKVAPERIRWAARGTVRANGALVVDCGEKGRWNG